MKKLSTRFEEWLNLCSFNSTTENAVGLIREWLEAQPENCIAKGIQYEIYPDKKPTKKGYYLCELRLESSRPSPCVIKVEHLPFSFIGYGVSKFFFIRGLK